MERFLQVLAGAVLTALLTLVLSKQGKDMAQVLSIAACCMVITVAAVYLQPVLAFIGKLQSLGQLDPDTVKIVLKAVGVSLIAEVAALICSDCGNSALGKAIQILAVGTVVWLSLPLLEGLMELIQKILGEV